MTSDNFIGQNVAPQNVYATTYMYKSLYTLQNLDQKLKQPHVHVHRHVQNNI